MALLSPVRERLCLQVAIALTGFLPVMTGILGSILGVGLTDEGVLAVSLDSHIRYLSGLLLGLGLAWWEAIPTIEKQGPRIRLITLIVALGGLVRLIGVLFIALPGPVMIVALVMELVAAPLLCLWQARIARLFSARI